MDHFVAELLDQFARNFQVKRDYHFFKVGSLDWSINSSQIWKGKTLTRIGLGIGTELLYGEADISMNYNLENKFDPNQLNYMWRWVDNDKRYIKQAQVGRIACQTYSLITTPVVGVAVRNSPTTVRKATGNHTVSGNTEPNWTVELYINNVLVDYTQADASGLYVFNVPVVYGYNTVKLKFYGPLGEERSEERTFNVPYTVMPVKKFEYGVSAGMLLNGIYSPMGKVDLNYGVTRYLTIGAGMEYLSTNIKNRFVPSVNVTVQPFSKLIINGDFALGYKTSCFLYYYFLKNALLEIEYSKFVKGQHVTTSNMLENWKAKLSLPFRIKKLVGYTRLDFDQQVYSELKYNQAAIVISAYYNQFSLNTSARINWISKLHAFISSDLSLSYRFNYGFMLRSSVLANLSAGSLVSCRIALEKRIPKGYLSVGYERNIGSREDLVTFGFKYDLPFARTNVSVAYNRGKVSASEGAQGSMMFGGGKNYTYVTKSSSVGKGSIALYPFLDLNNNGIYDKGEHMVDVRSVKVMGGNVIFRKRDHTIRVPDLNAFVKYNVEFSDNDLPSISYRFKNKIYQVLIDPNQFKRIDVPVIVVGEAIGSVSVEKENSTKGIGRIIIKFYEKENRNQVAQILSESDGYIDYLGLPPGKYYARLDESQLHNLGYSCEPEFIEFTIKTSSEGDMFDGLSFVLKPDIKK